MIVGATLSPTAEKVRRLMHYGQILQSHALHFFHLSSPDLLFGFDSEVGKRNIVGIAAAYPELAKQGVLLRKFGQEVIRVTAGKRIHGTGSVPGGVNKNVSVEERDYLLKDIGQVVAWSREAVGIARQLFEQNLDLYTNFGRFDTHTVNLVRADGALDLYHGGLRARDGQHTVRPLRLPALLGCDFRGREAMVVHEVPVSAHARAGRRLVSRRAADARNAMRFHPSPLAEAQRKEFLAFGNGSAARATLGFHWARRSRCCMPPK